MSQDRALTSAEIETLTQNGCAAEDWTAVQVGPGFSPRRVQRVRFDGQVRIGSLQGRVTLDGGVELPAELTDATIVNCTLGDEVRVTRIGSHLANYEIGDRAVVSGVGLMVTGPGATFGNGVEVEPVNEAGGRQLSIFAEMSSQFAYLSCMHRHHPELIARLESMVTDYTARAKSDRGRVGAGAVVTQVGAITDVNIGPAAQVRGALRLHNGTILSEAQAPAQVGAGVTAQDFIIGEGSSVKDGVVLSRCFVGQGVQLGKQFSGENSLFFANCEGFHGEACSIFAGPYTVTHHKSTLLIAGIYSFYNAGSGTNQSNHMYKLGPVHQGVVQRGSKNGSFSYMLWPTVVGPFSVIIGKHLGNLDTSELPFSYLTEVGGESMLTPAMNMHTVGLMRDGDKWPARDRRKGTLKRDLIHFPVFSPYLVQRMIHAEKLMLELHEQTPREVEQVRYKGAFIKRLLLRPSARNYASAIDMYLKGKVLDRLAPVRSQGPRAWREALADQGTYSESWADVGGMLVSCQRLEELTAAAAAGRFADAAQFQTALSQAHAAYDQDEWSWVRRTFAARQGQEVDQLDEAGLAQLEAEYKKLSASYLKKVLADAEKEFDPLAMLGYGADGDEAARAADFAAVRGSFAGNSFVKQLQARLAALSA
ncbi:MAG: DUF4954 family protein [Candidatus Latescibacteria bacterium]|nr:DUF4954 family protein [Candidatus Latescibacterota bacterium]